MHLPSEAADTPSTSRPALLRILPLAFELLTKLCAPPGRRADVAAISGLPDASTPAPPSHALEDVQPAPAVDEIEEPAVVHAHVVAGNARRALGHRRQKVPDLARRVRVGDVHDAQAAREPGHGNLGAGDRFARLMAARELGLRRAVGVYLEAREGHGLALVGDVHEPEERGRPL